MPRILFAPRARRWLRNEFAYLTTYPAGIFRLRERMEAAQLILSEHPRIGSPGPTTGIRRLVIPPDVVTYRLRNGDIEIAGIRHSRQAARPIPEDSG